MLRTVVTWVKRLMLFFWLIVMIIGGAWISYENGEALKLQVFGFPLPQMASGIYVCLFLFVGGLLGFATSFLLTQGKVFAKNRQLSQVNKEVAQLRTAQPSGE